MYISIYILYSSVHIYWDNNTIGNCKQWKIKTKNLNDRAMKALRELFYIKALKISCKAFHWWLTVPKLQK